MTSGAHGFWGKGRKAPVCSGAACLSGPACLHLQVEKRACSPVLVVSSFHYMVKRVALSSLSRFVSSEDTGACAWCDALQRYRMVPAAFLAPLHVVLPKTCLSFWKWSSWVRGVWFIVFNLSRSVKKVKKREIQLWVLPPLTAFPRHRC